MVFRGEGRALARWVGCLRGLLRAPATVVGVVTLALGAASAGVRAEDPPPEVDPATQHDLLELRDMSLGELMSLPLSTGSFLELDMRTSPVSLTFIDRAQIKASAARTLSELLEIYVPGFQYLVNKWNGDIWGMRGVAADRNTKIVFLINGLKQNTESRDGAYTELDLGLLDDIQRVEVLRGPAGLIYGSGSIAGVVNVVTRRPGVTSGSAATSFGTGTSISGEALSHVQGEQWGLTVSGGYRRSDGLGNRTTRIYGQPSFPAPIDQNFQPVPLPHGTAADGSMGRTPGNYRISADITFRDDVRWYTRYTHRNTSAGPYFAVDPFPEVVGFPPPDAAPRAVNGSVVGPTSSRARAESFGTNRLEYQVDNISSHLLYTPRIGPDRLTLEGAFIAAQNRQVNGYREGYAVEGAPDPAGRISSSMGERRYYVAAQYLLQRVAKLESASGASLRIDDIGPDLEGINMHGGVEARREVADVLYYNVAVYNETHYLPIDSVRVVAGLRMDKHTRTSYVFSAKAGVVYMPSLLHSIKLFGQSSYNAGSADNYEYTPAHYRPDGSPWDVTHLPEGPVNTPPDFAVPPVTTAELHSLEPEHAYSVELASTHMLLDALTLMPSASYTHINNLFAWAPSLQRVVNSGAYGVLSLELDLRADVRAIRFSAGASHVYQRPLGRDTSPKYYTRPDWEAYQLENGLWDVRETGGTITEDINTVSKQITTDGKHFLNLATNVTKLYIDYAPISWLHLHTDARFFWGVPGRKDLADLDRDKGYNTLGIDRYPMIKWNLGVRFHLPQDFWIGGHVYNLLASERNRHAVRWQQTTDWRMTQHDSYTVDLRYYAVSLEKEF
jgi:outer membrane receptor protein involved in Fe transport